MPVGVQGRSWTKVTELVPLAQKITAANLEECRKSIQDYAVRAYPGATEASLESYEWVGIRLTSDTQSDAEQMTDLSRALGYEAVCDGFDVIVTVR